MLQLHHCSVFECDVKILCYKFISICSTVIVRNALRDPMFNVVNIPVVVLLFKVSQSRQDGKQAGFSHSPFLRDDSIHSCFSLFRETALPAAACVPLSWISPAVLMDPKELLGCGMCQTHTWHKQLGLLAVLRCSISMSTLCVPENQGNIPWDTLGTPQSIHSNSNTLE